MADNTHPSFRQIIDEYPGARLIHALIETRAGMRIHTEPLGHADPAPEAADAEAPKRHLWLVQLASDTDEACAWERAFDNLILKMSRQGRLVGDEPERLGFLVRRGVQLMRQDHNEKIDAQRDKSGACGSAGQSDHGVLRLPSPAGAPASGVEGDRRDGGDHGCEAPEQRGEVRGPSEAAGGEGLLRAGGATAGEVDPPSEPEPAPTDPERAVIGWVSDNCGLTVAQEAELARRLESLRVPITNEQAARVERGPSADDQRSMLLRGSASDPGANPGGGATLHFNGHQFIVGGMPQSRCFICDTVYREAELVACEKPAPPLTGPNYLDQEEWGHEPAPSDTDTRMFPELRDLCGELEDRSVGADTIGIMYVRQRLEHAVGEAERKAARMLRGGAS